MRFIWRAWLAACVTVWPAVAAMAQEAEDPYEGTVPPLEESKPLAAWGLAAVFLVAGLAIAFKNSKRGHLD